MNTGQTLNSSYTMEPIITQYNISLCNDNMLNMCTGMYNFQGETFLTNQLNQAQLNMATSSL